MTSFKDAVKSALGKKQSLNRMDTKIDAANKSDSKRNQVNTNKPARKSAGRGR